MEIIRWFTSGAIKPGAEFDRGNSTKHCLFRLDSIDMELLEPNVKMQLINEQRKKEAENGDRSSNMIKVMISEDDENKFKSECISAFAKILGYDCHKDIPVDAKKL